MRRHLGSSSMGMNSAKVAYLPAAIAAAAAEPAEQAVQVEGA